MTAGLRPAAKQLTSHNVSMLVPEPLFWMRLRCLHYFQVLLTTHITFPPGFSYVLREAVTLTYEDCFVRVFNVGIILLPAQISRSKMPFVQ